MCANATPSESQQAPASSTRPSLFSRFTSPLKKHARNLIDFQIEPDEPYRQYSPGDWVKGSVVLVVLKPVRVTHLTVCLHGNVRVFKHPNGANDAVPEAGPVASSRRAHYFGNGHASLFQDEQTLCGEGRLEPAQYRFNFELLFPSKGLPSSIDVCYAAPRSSPLPTDEFASLKGAPSLT